LSRNRRAISWRVVGWGVGLQLAFAIFVLRVPLGHELFNGLGDAVKTILGFHTSGRSSCSARSASSTRPGGHLRLPGTPGDHLRLGVVRHPLLPRRHAARVKAFAVLMNKVMGASGAESLNVAASIFMGQTEARSPSGRSCPG